jgi:hypothetical protein
LVLRKEFFALWRHSAQCVTHQVKSCVFQMCLTCIHGAQYPAVGKAVPALRSIVVELE